MASDHERLDQAATHPLISRYYADPAGRLAFMRDLFNGTAPYYDPINRWFSLGTGSRYRRACLKRAGLRPGHRVVDVAVGTGLLAREALAITGDRDAIIGVDVSEAMLAIAQKKLGISLAQGAAESLPIAGRSADFVTMGYALRHFADVEAAFREAYRVLRSGGKLLLLDISSPSRRLPKLLASVFIGGIVPLVSIVATGDRRAHKLMRYHWRSITDCVPPEVVVEAMERAGFREVECDAELDLFRAYLGRK
jgi:demethylmenaquinone methyltransferase/2-methoxy-6-polyprenyl-1,4-benzoquinol methylase